MARKEEKDTGLDIGLILGGKPSKGKGKGKGGGLVLDKDEDTDEMDMDMEMEDDLFANEDEDIAAAEAEIVIRLGDLFDGDSVKATTMLDILKDMLELHS